jgi:23S rRNA pseudouridine1911/1915/1917 synthase
MRHGFLFVSIIYEATRTVAGQPSKGYYRKQNHAPRTGYRMTGMTPFGNHREPALIWTGPEGLAVAKPAGMHSAPGSNPDGSSLAEWVFQRYPELGRIKGRSKGEGGLIHRLDRDTEGLVLFARTEAFFAGIAAQAAAGGFIKSYLARAVPGCGGLAGSRPLLATPGGTEESAWKDALRRQDQERLSELLSGAFIEGRFRPFGPGSKRVACMLPAEPCSLKAWTKDLYTTRIQAACPADTALLVDVRLARGFRHQVRAHLAWVGLSLEGDALYGEGGDDAGADAPETGLKLLAYALSFKDPANGAEVSISLPGI